MSLLYSIRNRLYYAWNVASFRLRNRLLDYHTCLGHFCPEICLISNFWRSKIIACDFKLSFWVPTLSKLDEWELHLQVAFENFRLYIVNFIRYKRKWWELSYYFGANNKVFLNVNGHTAQCLQTRLQKNEVAVYFKHQIIQRKRFCR